MESEQSMDAQKTNNPISRKCERTLYFFGGWPSGQWCDAPGVVEVDGNWYCSTHDPAVCPCDMVNNENGRLVVISKRGATIVEPNDDLPDDWDIVTTEEVAEWMKDIPPPSKNNVNTP